MGLHHEQFKSIELDIQVKGDKFLYYKRRLQQVENRVKVFPFWNNLYMWGNVVFSFITFYFILFLLDKSFERIPKDIILLHIDTTQIALPKGFIYSILFIPVCVFIINYLIAYKFYNSKRYVSLLVITFTTISIILILTTLIKTIQMHFAIIV